MEATEVYEDVDEAMWLGLTPEQIARNEAQLKAANEAEDRRNEWEAYSIRMIEMEEAEEGDFSDNYPLELLN